MQVDAGEAFNFIEGCNKFRLTFNMTALPSSKPADPRDLQFGNA